MKIIKKEILWGYAFLLVALAWIFGLFIDLTGDSGLYAAITRQMVESGDWFNLQINGRPYDQKPHLFFWLAGLGVKLFGNTNFAFKLFPFIYTCGGIYFTWRLGKTIYSKEVGKLAALILATSQISFMYFHDFHMDTIMQTGVMLALWQLAEYFKKRKAIHFILGFVGVGLAMLSKGPIGAVIPFFAVLFFLFSLRDYKQLFHPKWLLGILIVLVCISPSLVLLYKNFGVEGIQFYFITNNFGRITGEYAGSNSDPMYYVHTLLWAFLPWTVFVFAGIFFEYRNWIFRKNFDAWGFFLLGGTLTLLIILSIAKGKAPNYCLIAIAPLSVIAAKWMQFENIKLVVQKRLRNIHWIILGLVLVLSLVAACFLANHVLVPVIVIVISALAIFYLQKNRLLVENGFLLQTVLVIATFNVVLNATVLPTLYEYQAARRVLEIYEENRNNDDQLYNYHPHDLELFYYAENPVVQIQNWEHFRSTLDKKGTWIYTNVGGRDEIMLRTGKAGKVYKIKYKGMNKLSLPFINPRTREKSLDTNYLVRVGKTD